MKSLLSYAGKVLSKPIVKRDPFTVTVTATHLKELLDIYGNCEKCNDVSTSRHFFPGGRGGIMCHVTPSS